jgi:uncharacterized protein YigA (DUF484 family)
VSKKAPRQDAPDGTALTDAQVAQFLRDEPEFLSRHPQLLWVLMPPEREFADAATDGGEVVDLQGAMLARLRAELSRSETQCSDLIDAGRANMQSQNRIHAAALALLKARSIDHLVEILTIDLAGLLHVDAVSLCLEGGTVAPTTNQGVRVVPTGTIDKIVESTRVVTLEANVEGDRRIYGEAAGLVRSQALLRLAVREGAPCALLAMGSRDPTRFHSGQGTELLGFLASIMEHCIRTWLDLPR